MKSYVDLIAASVSRSERRNMLQLAHASISINTGTPGKMQAWDSLQEYFVLTTKKFMPQTLSNQHLHRVLYRNTSNLGVPLRLLPHLRELFARLKPVEAATNGMNMLPATSCTTPSALRTKYTARRMRAFTLR